VVTYLGLNDFFCNPLTTRDRLNLWELLFMVINETFIYVWQVVA